MVIITFKIIIIPLLVCSDDFEFKLETLVFVGGVVGVEP